MPVKPLQWALTLSTRGDSMTCMGMYGSGVWIGMGTIQDQVQQIVFFATFAHRAATPFLSGRSSARHGPSGSLRVTPFFFFCLETETEAQAAEPAARRAPVPDRRSHAPAAVDVPAAATADPKRANR